MLFSGGTDFPRLIAIRYLAGILDLPAFWLDNYQIQKLTMEKLCKQSLRLVEDINPDSVSAEDFNSLTLLDPDGVDVLVEAALVGGERWLLQIKGLGSDCWLASFIKLIKALRGCVLSQAYRSAPMKPIICQIDHA